MLINGAWRIQGATGLATAQDDDTATRRHGAQLGVGVAILSRSSEGRGMVVVKCCLHWEIHLLLDFFK